MDDLYTRLLGFTLALAVLLSASLAFAACPPIPHNSVWGSVSPGAIVNHVKKVHGGDWQPYIDKWETRLAETQQVQKRNSILVFHNSGTWLRGEELAAYVADIRERVDVTKCIAAKTRDGETPGTAYAGSAVGAGS